MTGGARRMTRRATLRTTAASGCRTRVRVGGGVEGDDVEVVRLREGADDLLAEILGQEIVASAGAGWGLDGDVEVVPVVSDDHLGAGVDDALDLVGDGGLHDVEGTHHVHA